MYLITRAFSIVLVHGYDWYQWINIYSIGEMYLIVGTLNIFVGFRLSGGTYLSIGMIGTIGITLILLVKFISWQTLDQNK